MRIAVTGSDGFTGRYLLDELERRGLSCVPISANLTDADAVHRSVEAADFDALIHLAAIAFAGGSDWRAFYNVNQLGTFTLLDAVARHRPGAACLLASSAQVYGPHAEGMITENFPCRPFNHYALSKYAMELGAGQWADRLDIRIARPFNYTGVGQEARYLVPKIVDHFARREDVIELGNTKVKRDIGDVRGVVRAYCDLILADQPGLMTNISTGRLSSIDDLIASLSDMTGHQIEIRVNPDFVRANDVPVLGGDTRHLQELIPGWEAIPLETTLEWMLAASEEQLG